MMHQRKSHRKPTGSEEEDAIAARTTPSSEVSSDQSSWPTVLSLLLLLVILVGILSQFLSTLAFLRIVTMLPTAVSLVIAVRPRIALEERILPLTLVATVVSAQFPTFLGAAIAATSITLFSLATLASSTTTDSPQQQSGNRTKQVTRVVLAVVFLVAVLLTENFLVWVVSATFVPGHRAETAPPPLQDNGQRILEYLLHDLSKRQVVSLRRLWNVQWSLVSCLGASFVLVEVFPCRQVTRRQLYTLGTRAVLVLAAARLIRTMSFLLTVLPSQDVYCYSRRQDYPNPPPTDWYEWIKVGLVPASHGGCNDLIISGHATVTSTLACVATSVSGNWMFGLALWSMVALDYMVEIYEGFHYSVDMWLGMVLVCLLWRVLAPVEESEEATETKKASPPSHRIITHREGAIYSIPAVIAFLQVSVLPQYLANLLIVGYVVVIVGIYVRFVHMLPSSATTREAAEGIHFGQHTLLCLLYLGLGVYL